MSQSRVLIVGQGEVGKPLASILSDKYQVFTKDIEPLDLAEPVDVMHICFPFQVGDFVETAAGYIAQYQPALTIIHSTVVPGTTRRVHRRCQQPVAYSPVRGKHTTMKSQMLSYTKYVSGVPQEASYRAVDHFNLAGMRTECFSSPEALELAKLVETTYFGLLIAWAQEVERYCKGSGVDYDEVMQFTREISYLPPVVFQPGFIGGHCVMPNIRLLETLNSSPFLDAIKQSNEKKAAEWAKAGRRLEERLSPSQLDQHRG